MTLIVGILCKEGIVVGADGAASLGVMGMMTARQPVKKLSLFTHPLPMVVGVSGSVGMSQRISTVFSKLNISGKGGASLKPTEAMVVIRQQLWTECIQPELRIATDAKALYNHVAMAPVQCACVAALPVSRELCLIQFDQQGAPELATKDLPFVAIGSGQPCADTFLAFLRHIFWSDHQPNLAEGIFAACWTLEHAIRTSPGGVAEPKQLAVLEMKSGVTTCRELDKDELVQHEEAVTNAENFLKEFQRKRTDPAPAIPQPPTG